MLNRMSAVCLSVFYGVLVMAGALRLSAQATSMPGITIPQCSQAPVLDGDLADAAWQEAATVSNFFVVDTAAPIFSGHSVKLMTDKEWLYAGFRIWHPSPARILHKARLHDDPVQRENCVKLALDPGTGGRNWYLFRLSAGNIRADQRFYEPDYTLGKLGWKIPWRSATRLTDFGWQAEMAVPMALLTANARLEQARLNLMVMSGYAGDADRVIYSWAPVNSAWWLEADRFGSVQGWAGRRFNLPFLPQCEKTRILGYQFDQSGMGYRVCTKLQTFSKQPGSVWLTLTDQPVASQEQTVSRKIELAGQRSVLPIELTMPVTSLVQRTARLELKDALSGEVLQSQWLHDTQALELLTVFPDRNYYTTEKEARLICRVNLPEQRLNQTVLLVKDMQDCVHSRLRVAQAETEAKLDLRSLPIGNILFEVDCCWTNGDILARQTVAIRKKAPQPGCEWKIDQQQRVLLREGKPFFPVGVFMARITPDQADVFKDVAGLGVNCVVHWAQLDAAAAVPFLDLAATNNLLAIMKVENFLPGVSLSAFRNQAAMQEARRQGGREAMNRLFAQQYDQAEPIMADVIRRIKDHPALMAYYTFDEPTQLFDQYIEGRRLYRLIQELDGYRPSYNVWNMQPPDDEQWTDWSDLLGRDIYWAPPPRGLQDSPLKVAKWTALLDRRATALHKPTLITPMAEYTANKHKRMIRPDEQRAQTYLALIHGARALVYFSYPLFHQVSWDCLRQLADEIRQLSPALTAPEVPQVVDYGSNGYDSDQDIYPDVHVRLCAFPQGELVLLAANSRQCPVDAEYTISILSATGTVRRLFSPECYPVTGRSFKDRLEPNGVRAYVISERPTAAGIAAEQLQSANHKPPITELAVRARPDQSQAAPPETVAPRTGRPDHKNLIPNASFEESSVPGLPDYWNSGRINYDQRMGGTGAVYVMDANAPYHGQFALRMQTAAEAGRALRIGLEPITAAASNFVFSAFVRADRDGVPVQLSGCGWRGEYPHKRVFMASTNWQRYVLPVTLPRRVPRKYGFGILVNPQPTNVTVWVDAAQLEAGTDATAFDP